MLFCYVYLLLFSRMSKYRLRDMLHVGPAVKCSRPFQLQHEDHCSFKAFHSKQTTGFLLAQIVRDICCCRVLFNQIDLGQVV